MDIFDTGEKASGSTPLVLLHGWLDSRRSWDLVMAEQVAADRRVVAVTFRGWGDAEKTGVYSVDAYAADVVSLLDSLSIATAVMGGHSMGTLVATAVAARAPGRISALVLAGATATMRPEHVLDPSDRTTSADIAPLCRDWAAAGAPDIAVLESFQLDDLRPFVEAGTTPQSFAAQVMAETLKADVWAIGKCWQSMLDEDHCAELANVAIPVLVVWGTADGVFVEEDQAALVAALTKASVRRVTVEGAPHGVIWTHAPRVAAAMADFFREFSV